MPLTAEALAAFVYAEHLTRNPLAIDANRENPETGVPLHNVPDAFIGALCTGFVNALTTMVIKDIGGGTLDVPGTAIPVPFTFPGIAAAKAAFLISRGWIGGDSSKVAETFVGGPLRGAQALGLLQMRPNLLMGTGAGVVSPASNPDLLAAMKVALETQLPLAFQATGKFAVDDVPGGPVNATLAAQLSDYATALATGTASITAAVAYVGVTTPTTPVAGAVNTGSIA